MVRWGTKPLTGFHPSRPLFTPDLCLWSQRGFLIHFCTARVILEHKNLCIIIQIEALSNVLLKSMNIILTVEPQEC